MWPPPHNFLQESAIDMKFGPVIPYYDTIRMKKQFFGNFNFLRDDVTNYSGNCQNLAKKVKNRFL